MDSYAQAFQELAQSHQNNGLSSQKRESTYDNAFKKVASQYSPSDKPQEEFDSILDQPAPLTQAFGNNNPQDEVFSGGINNGADFGAPIGTHVKLPPGQWQVVDSYNQDTQPGYIGDSTNQGYGNSVLVKNLETGEMMRFSHLSENMTSPGQVVPGGSVIGATGSTGNVSAPHLDAEYYDQNGNLADILSSPYGKYLLKN